MVNCSGQIQKFRFVGGDIEPLTNASLSSPPYSPALPLHLNVMVSANFMISVQNGFELEYEVLLALKITINSSVDEIDERYHEIPITARTTP